MKAAHLNLLYLHVTLMVTYFPELVISLPKGTPELERYLQFTPDYHLSWVLYSNDEIVFNISVRSDPDQYVGFGISLSGGMKASDIIIARVLENGRITVEDRHGISNTEEPVPDSSQDWVLLHGQRNMTHTSFQVTRPLKTGDPDDVDITEDTLRFIWAVGNLDVVTGRIVYHGPNSRGSVSVNILDPAVNTPSHDQLLNDYGYQLWKTQKTVAVSSNETVYMCSFFKGPNVPRKNHIIGFGMHIDHPVHKPRIHHADLYRCVAPEGVDSDAYFSPFLGNGYDCNYSPVKFPYENCGLFEFQWTLGGGITLFPDNLGMPVGRDDGKVEYFMTEVHFDNPERRSDLVITAGFNIYHTPNLRETEVGHLQLGFMTNKTYALTVPPNSTDFVVSSHCPLDCTKTFPPDGINVFTYLMHSHLSGRKLKLRHFRDSKELVPLAKDDYFDFNYQNNRRLRKSKKVYPGDHLTIECTYDTTWKHGGTTLGGRSKSEEMCQAFLLYWPRMEDVNSCGSYHKQEEILGFMGVEKVHQYQGEVDATVLAPSNLEGLKYSHVVQHLTNWTEDKRAAYQKLMKYGDQRAYCIPREYHNETFVMTNYPRVLIQDGGNQSRGCSKSANILIIISFFVVAILLVWTVAYFVKKCKYENNPPEEDKEKGKGCNSSNVVVAMHLNSMMADSGTGSGSDGCST